MSHNGFGITTIELLVAVIILSLIVLSITPIETTWRSFLHRSNIRGALYMEETFALDHMIRNISQGVGINTFPAACASAPTGTCRGCELKDINSNDIYIRIQDDTPENLCDNPWRRYRLDANTNRIEFDPDPWSSGDEYYITDEDVTALSFVVSLTVPNLVKISIIARGDPDRPADTVSNPEIQTQISVVMQSMTMSPD